MRATVFMFASWSAFAQTYLITTVAGVPEPASVGDGGPAISAALADTPFVATDNAGNLFVAAGTRVRKIGPDGIISTVVGIGRSGDSGDDGLARLARTVPVAIAVDPAGNIFIAERFSARVRRVGSDRVIRTVAGTGVAGYTGDGGPALEAQIRAGSIAVDGAGNLYLSDGTAMRVRKVSPDGIITTVAGNGQRGAVGDGGPATEAAVEPGFLAVDGAGNLFISSRERVRKVDRAGMITTIAGGLPGFGGDGGPATDARLNGASGIAVDERGNVYIADTANDRIRKVGPDGIVTTFAGNGIRGTRGDGGPATDATLTLPLTVVTDRRGNVYIGSSSTVRRVGPDGIIQRVAGGGSGDEGPAARAFLGPPLWIAFDRSGNLYVAEEGRNRVRKIDPSGIIHTVAGIGFPGFAGDGGPATEALLNSPSGVAVDAAGNLFIADKLNQRVRKVDPAGRITTVAGTGAPRFTGDGMLAVRSALNQPSDVAVDAAGNLYIADSMNNRVRKVTPGGVIQTIAQEADLLWGVELDRPNRLALDREDNLYIAESGRIHKLTPGGVLSLMNAPGGLGGLAAGENGVLYVCGGSAVLKIVPGAPPVIIAGGPYGLEGDAGIATKAGLSGLGGIALDGNGNIYLTNWFNFQAGFVRKLEPANIFPLEVVNAASQRHDFIAPGEIVDISWADMGPSQPAAAIPGPDHRYGAVLADTRVLFDGIAAPVLYADQRRVTAIVPYGLAGRDGTALYVEHGGKRSNVIGMTMQLAAPGIFAAILNEDLSVNSASNPASPGTVVALFGTGDGSVSPTPIDGSITGPAPPRTVLPVRVRVGGQPAEVLYAGAAPGLVAGVFQVNARLPENLRPGSHPVAVMVDGAESPPVQVAVR